MLLTQIRSSISGISLGSTSPMTGGATVSTAADELAALVAGVQKRRRGMCAASTSGVTGAGKRCAAHHAAARHRHTGRRNTRRGGCHCGLRSRCDHRRGDTRHRLGAGRSAPATSSGEAEAAKLADLGADPVPAAAELGSSPVVPARVPPAPLAAPPAPPAALNRLISGEMPIMPTDISGDSMLIASDDPAAEDDAAEDDAAAAEDDAAPAEDDDPAADAPVWEAAVTGTGFPIAETALAWVASELCTSVMTCVACVTAWAAAANTAAHPRGK